MGLTNVSAGANGNNQDIINKLDEILAAFNGLQFNQPPLTNTSPAPAKVIFLPGETKQIIPAGNSPRRIIIKSLIGEIKLLLGTSANIANSAISVKGDRICDERWAGAVFAYSELGGEILINIEIE